MDLSWLGRVRMYGNRLFHRIATERIRRNILQAIPFWIASLLTGVVAVGYTKLFGFAEQGLHTIVEHRPLALLALSPLLFVLGFVLVNRFAPFARGSGIPQVMAAMEVATPKYDHLLDKLLSIRIILVKIASSLLMVMGGAVIGREGPTIQISGSIFRTIEKWIPASWPKLSRQSFILTGAAAGLAAAFNTPLGGVVFAMEELARIHVRFFRTALFSAVIIGGLTAQGLLGPYLYLGYPDVSNPNIMLFFPVAIVAFLSGGLGSFMCKIILRILEWRRSLSFWPTIGFVVAVGLVIAATAVFIDTRVLGSGKEVITHMLFTGDKQVSWYTPILRIVGPILCFNTGAAGGVFAPALAAGASVGGYISTLGHFAGSNANILILSGMVGFLTGVTRTPFTSAILVLEMTDRHNVIFHLMLAALLSNLAAMLVDKHSFYEQLRKTYLPAGWREEPEQEPDELHHTPGH